MRDDASRRISRSGLAPRRPRAPRAPRALAVAPSRPPAPRAARSPPPRVPRCPLRPLGPGGFGGRRSAENLRFVRSSHDFKAPPFDATPGLLGASRGSHQNYAKSRRAAQKHTAPLRAPREEGKNSARGIYNLNWGPWILPFCFKWATLRIIFLSSYLPKEFPRNIIRFLFLLSIYMYMCSLSYDLNSIYYL